MYIDQLNDRDTVHDSDLKVNNDLCYRLSQILRNIEYCPYCCQLPFLQSLYIMICPTGVLQVVVILH